MLKQADFFRNVEGLNLTDSPFYVKDGQATGGYNYDYVKTGGIQKILGISKINAVANTQLNTLGSGVHITASSGTKTVVRAAGTKIQVFDTTAGTFTNQAEDTVTATTDFLSSSSTQPVICANFNTSTADELWLSGGGLAALKAYVTYTVNGEYTLVTSGAGSGLFVASNTASFTLNGRSYSVPFLTSNVITLTNVATAIAADQDVLSAYVSDNIHTITVTSRAGATLTFASVSVTGGSTQPTITVTQTIAPASTSTAKITTNGVSAPTGTFTAVASSGSGTWGAGTGTYFYALALRKKSTQSISNCALDVSATISAATDQVLLTFPTGIDTTKYDKWYVYRSSVSGVSGFTAGSLVAQVNTSTATFTDTNIAVATSQNVPRAGNTLLDNSVLPTDTYTCVSTWKRRLVAIAGNTLYISDLNKPDSWPLGLRFQIPTGGPLRSVTRTGYNSPSSASVDELAVLHSDTELWAVSGEATYSSTTGLYDVSIKFVDYAGCPNPALVVKFGGFLAWVDVRGIYMWSGLYKPVYVSRPIEGLFGDDGSLDKTKLNTGFGVFFRKKNQVIWTLSDRTKGQNKIQIKLDVRLTSPQVTDTITNSIDEGVFNMDAYGTALYAGVTYLTDNNTESFLVFDNAGFAYNAYAAVSDNGSGIAFNYTTKAFDLGLPSIAKQFNCVVVWIDRASAKDLTLKYWAGYRTLQTQYSKQTKHMDTKTAAHASRWDLAVWDESLWDDYTTNIVPMRFNLDASQNNNQGEAIQLDFSQIESSAPVLIHGFSIFWEPLGLRLQ